MNVFGKRISSWDQPVVRGNEPGIRGSYSFVPVGASGQDIDELAKPEGEEMSLAFAGEHTHRTLLVAEVYAVSLR